MNTQTDKPNPLDITKRTTPISKMKSPVSLSFYKDICDQFSMRTWNSGGDHGIYINMHLAQFFRSGLIMPPLEKSVLERDIQPDIEKITFTLKDGSQTISLKDYLHEGGPRRVQCMMMAHKGKVVFEAFPGMNPTDAHVWMSSSKPTTSILTTLLEQHGLFSYDDPVTKHVPQLADSAWEKVSYRNAANMSAGLDIEETFANYTVPDSWINQWIKSIIYGQGDDWIKVMRAAKPLPNEKPGDRMRYSTPNTQILVMAVENIIQKPWMDVFNEMVWSHIGANGPLFTSLTPDGVALAGSMHSSAPEDFLRFAMIFSPSWNKVSKTQIVTDKVLDRLRTLGNFAAFEGSQEQSYAHDFFGEKPYTNSNQWDWIFEDGAMHKHGNMGQGMYVDPARDFVGINFALCPNEGERGPDHSPGYLRAAARMLAGK
jgi:CubicO group peptidase (beta-lactamase class C family)